MRRSLSSVLVLVLALVTCALWPGQAEAQCVGFAACKALWESHMTTQGTVIGNGLPNCPGYPTATDCPLNTCYYDGQRVNIQIGNYVGNMTPWHTFANNCRLVWRDNYSIPNGGHLPGFNNFTQGMTLDAEQFGDATSRNTVNLQARNAAFSDPNVNIPLNADFSREISYATMAHHNSLRLGFAPIIQNVGPFAGQVRLPHMIDSLFNYIDQLFVQFCWKGVAPFGPGVPVGPCTAGPNTQFSPFQVGLMAQALIKDWLITADVRTIPALELMADWLINGDADVPTPYWVRAGNEGGGWIYDAVNSCVTGPECAASDLNLLVVPMYSFLWQETATVAYRDRFDLAFGDGVNYGFIGNGKQFDQNYMWSFDGVAYRGAAATPPFATTLQISAPGVIFPAAASINVIVSSLNGTPTGNVVLSVDGGAGSTKALSGGVATYSVSGLAVGTHTLSATYAAQGNFLASSNTGTVSVGAASPPLVLAYSFSEGTGTTVHDHSGQGNDGTLVNTTWSSSGKYGNAINCNGSSSRVTTPNAPELQLTTGMTLEAWVRPTVSIVNWTDIIYKGGDNYFLEASSPFNAGAPAVGGIWSGANVFLNSAAAIPAGTFTHLAGTWDGTTLRFYINGVLAAQTPRAGTIQVTTNPLTLCSDPQFGQFFNGLVDEVRIYNVALTQPQIVVDMNTPINELPEPVLPPPNLLVK